MKNTTKHIICIAAIVIIAMGGCHKDAANTTSHTHSTNTDSINRLDSIHTVDSLHTVDSVHQISLIIDSSVGKYWCEHWYHYNAGPNRTDTLLGHDTVTVSRGAAANQMVVNGETFTYKSNSSGYPDFSNGDPGYGGNSHLSYAQFGNTYTSITYMVAYIHISAAAGSEDEYTGTRIP